MSRKNFQRLLESLQQWLAYERGEIMPGRVFDVRPETGEVIQVYPPLEVPAPAEAVEPKKEKTNAG